MSSENGDAQNGDPGYPLSWDNRDPDPHFTIILGTPDAHYHGDYGDPFVKMGTPINFAISYVSSSSQATPTLSTLQLTFPIRV